MTNTKINFCGVEFKNPIVTASGTFGFGMEYNEFVSIEEYGGFGAKGLTRVPREGNKPPRIAETPSGILNSVGLQNPGVEHFAKHIMPILAEYDTNVIFAITPTTIPALKINQEKKIKAITNTENAELKWKSNDESIVKIEIGRASCRERV